MDTLPKKKRATFEEFTKVMDAFREQGVDNPPVDDICMKLAEGTPHPFVGSPTTIGRYKKTRNALIAGNAIVVAAKPTVDAIAARTNLDPDELRSVIQAGIDEAFTAAVAKFNSECAATINLQEDVMEHLQEVLAPLVRSAELRATAEARTAIGEILPSAVRTSIDSVLGTFLENYRTSATAGVREEVLARMAQLVRDVFLGCTAQFAEKYGEAFCMGFQLGQEVPRPTSN